MTKMTNRFKIEFSLNRIGRVTEREVFQLVSMDLLNYSFIGDLYISHDQQEMRLPDTPLFEAFLAIRRILQIVPVFCLEAPYGQMWRKTKTTISMRGNQIQITHEDEPTLQHLVGQNKIVGDYVDFCTAFGDATRRLVSMLEEKCPTIWTNRNLTNDLAILLDCKVGSGIRNSYSVI
jgi:hypothetical protein